MTATTDADLSTTSDAILAATLQRAFTKHGAAMDRISAARAAGDDDALAEAEHERDVTHDIAMLVVREMSRRTDVWIESLRDAGART